MGVEEGGGEEREGVMKVTYPPFYFLTFITSNGLHAYGHTHRP
jgi:hypothetical protein